MKESIHRSLIKTISWRFTGSSATMVVAYMLTGDLAKSGSIALLQMATNTFLYFIHERVWIRIKWGAE